MTTPELDFEDFASAQLDHQAAALVEAGTVIVNCAENPPVSSLRIDGPCPRCHHTFIQTRALALPATSIRGASKTPAPSATWADFMCECTVAHPGTPPGQQGCGANYTIIRPSPSP